MPSSPPKTAFEMIHRYLQAETALAEIDRQRIILLDERAEAHVQLHVLLERHPFVRHRGEVWTLSSDGCTIRRVELQESYDVFVEVDQSATEDENSAQQNLTEYTSDRDRITAPASAWPVFPADDNPDPCLDSMPPRRAALP